MNNKQTEQDLKENEIENDDDLITIIKNFLENPEPSFEVDLDNI